MPSARSRLADIEGPGLGSPLRERVLREREIVYANVQLKRELEIFLADVNANKQQCAAARDALTDLIADATARQLREIEEGEDG